MEDWGGNKQVSEAWISNYIPQGTVGCNYLSMSQIPASSRQVLKYYIISWVTGPGDTHCYMDTGKLGIIKLYGIKEFMDQSTEFYTLRPGQICCHFADDIFKCIFLKENAWISFKNSLKFIPKVWINNNPALVQIMAWCRPGNKPLSEPMMVNLLTHICITQPQ